MGRLIKMDFYRLFRSKLFWITNIILFGISFAVNFAMPFITDWSISVLKSSEVTVSEADLAAMEASKTALFSNLLAFQNFLS